MSEYEPGTVALVDVRGERDVLAFCVPEDATFGGRTWRGARRVNDNSPYQMGTFSFDERELSNIRPLHVLADDEVAVNATDLWGALLNWQVAQSPGGKRLRARHDAHLAARTPQVEEPQWLGAVVEGGGGNRWVKCDKRSPMWHSPSEGWADWDDIRATRVLSEGVRLDEEAAR